MEKSQFIKEIECLRNTYGNKAYPDERVKVIWSTFKNYQYTDFHHGVRQLIGDSNRPPMLPDLKSTIRRSIILVDHGPCENCDRTGFIPILKKGISYVYRCHCKWGGDLCEGIPLYESEAIRDQSEEPAPRKEEVQLLMEEFLNG